MKGSAAEQLKVLREGLIDIISENELAELLEASVKKKKPLRIKYGADPSAPDLHLGHTVPLRKLREFQDFGHTIVFIIGDFTAQIGDPTGRSETRKRLTSQEVKANAKTYQDQVFGILDKKKTEVRFNSEWLGKLKTADILDLTAKYTVARLLERDDFQKRYREGQPIALVEFMYPLFQGYDSVCVESDIEIGGTDQKFNLLVGRDLQKIWNQKPQLVLTLPLIEGTDGVRKMSKSFNNHIAIRDTPTEMFGKVMAIPDPLMETYYKYVLCLKAEEKAAILKDLKSGKLHPREAKANLAESIVALFHDEKKAKRAREEFDQIFKQKGLPDNVPDVALNYERIDLATLLKDAKLVASKGEGRRLIQQGGVKIDQAKVDDPALEISLKTPVLIQCGKRKFAKVFYAK